MNCFLTIDRNRNIRYAETIMKIYTGTGDRGKTSLFSGERVSKASERIEISGPLLSPVGALYQVVGVYSAELVEPLAAALAELGAHRALVVHGQDGLDELTTTGPSAAALVAEGKIRTLRVEPGDGARCSACTDSSSRTVLLGLTDCSFLDAARGNRPEAMSAHGDAARPGGSLEAFFRASLEGFTERPIRAYRHLRAMTREMT